MFDIGDNYKEHCFHTDEYDPRCSTCYSEKRKYSMSDDNADFEGGFVNHERDLELGSELSAHPSNLYW
jgi:hypothetical protein